jgi:hypothetical protein
VACLNDRETVQAGERDRLGMEEVTGEDPSAWARRNSPHAGPDLRGAVSIPAFFKIAHAVDGAILRPGPVSSAAILR